MLGEGDAEELRLEAATPQSRQLLLKHTRRVHECVPKEWHARGWGVEQVAAPQVAAQASAGEVWREETHPAKSSRPRPEPLAT